MEIFEASGQWWLPERPEIKVSGTLSVAKSGRAELRLIGSLRSLSEAGRSVTEGGLTTTIFSEESMQASGVYPRILGIADGKVFTLDDCLQTRRTENLFGGGLAYETIHVHQVLRGAHFDLGEALEFTSLQVTMDWLPYWVERGGISESVNFTDEEGEGFRALEYRLSIKSVETQDFEGLDGATVKLCQSYGLTGDSVTEKRVWQDFYFVIEFPDLAPLGKLLYQVGALQDLVSVGMGKVAAVKSVTLRRPDVAHEFGDTSRELPIDFLAHWQVSNSEEPKRLHSFAMPFSLAQLGGVEGVAAWLKAVEPYSEARRRVMATKYAESQYVSDSFLNCAAALEGYDRTKYADDIYYVDRLKRCAKAAGGEFADLVGDTKLWATTVEQMRNDIAHHNPGVELASTEQLVLGRSIYWLVILCLLREAGAPEAVFANIAQHDAFTRLRAQISNLGLV